MAKLPVNPRTQKSGVPRFAGPGERQLDGSHTPTFTPPQRKPGMAAREAVPNRASDSGMERAMQAHADTEHPGRKR